MIKLIKEIKRGGETGPIGVFIKCDTTFNNSKRLKVTLGMKSSLEKCIEFNGNVANGICHILRT